MCHGQASLVEPVQRRGPGEAVLPNKPGIVDGRGIIELSVRPHFELTISGAPEPGARYVNSGGRVLFKERPSGLRRQKYKPQEHSGFMTVRQKRYCVLDKGLRLGVGRICDNVDIDGFALRQEVKSRAAKAVIHQVGRQNLMTVLAKDLGDMPAAATGFPYVFREAFEL